MLKEVELDFSKWEEATGRPKEHAGTIAGNVLARAIDDEVRIYVDENTGDIFVPIMSVSLFEKYYGNVIFKKGDKNGKNNN
ncbi:MAG: hypothetical protein J6Y02_12770 [Pseudobutyrivibrio sp.]|nr:hypothetical protein [Pseudobutyrivibrio sp.]